MSFRVCEGDEKRVKAKFGRWKTAVEIGRHDFPSSRTTIMMYLVSGGVLASRFFSVGWF